eukprot:RCo035909
MQTSALTVKAPHVAFEEPDEPTPGMLGASLCKPPRSPTPRVGDVTLETGSAFDVLSEVADPAEELVAPRQRLEGVSSSVSASPTSSLPAGGDESSGEFGEPERVGSVHFSSTLSPTRGLVPRSRTPRVPDLALGMSFPPPLEPVLSSASAIPGAPREAEEQAEAA